MKTSTHHTLESTNTKPTFLFVYNADTGLFNVVTDYAHKILSPKTYPCNLCAITYGNMGMNKKWKKFIATLDFPVEFLHRDEFFKQYDLRDMQLPAAFVKREKDISVLVTHNEINECTSVEELMHLITRKIKTIT